MAKMDFWRLVSGIQHHLAARQDGLGFPEVNRGGSEGDSWRGSGVGGRFQVFQAQFQLSDLPVQLLRLAAELHALELENEQLQVLDPAEDVAFVVAVGEGGRPTPDRTALP